MRLAALCATKLPCCASYYIGEGKWGMTCVSARARARLCVCMVWGRQVVRVRFDSFIQLA
eukprot:SAG11_NODE_114_length_16040_cov_10.050875_20_plen_60_part_00